MFYFDEIDKFLADIKARTLNPDDEEDIIDEILDLYLLGYLEGANEAASELNTDETPSVNEMQSVIEKKIGGKTWRERVHDYLNGDMGSAAGTPGEAIARVVDTEATRIYNESLLHTAEKHGATTKTWVTMSDEKVRDSHFLLEGMTIPIDAYFYTATDKALAPGGFETAEENANCRCVLSVR